MNPEFQARLLDPPLQTADLPGIGGRTRMRPEDFAVHEIPAYGPDGRPGAHLLFTLRKRGIGTEDAIVELSRQTGIPRPEIGLAVLKDKDAVTEQWISVPFAAGPRLAEFSHPAISLGPPTPHGNKLRRGHLHGNRFSSWPCRLVFPPRRCASSSRATKPAPWAPGRKRHAISGCATWP